MLQTHSQGNENLFAKTQCIVSQCPAPTTHFVYGGNFHFPWFRFPCGDIVTRKIPDLSSFPLPLLPKQGEWVTYLMKLNFPTLRLFFSCLFLWTNLSAKYICPRLLYVSWQGVCSWWVLGLAYLHPAITWINLFNSGLTNQQIQWATDVKPYFLNLSVIKLIFGSIKN